MAEVSKELFSVPGVGRLIATNPTDVRTREFVLLKPEVAIGSDEVNDFVIRDESVSRRHAVITFKQGQLEISDVGSTNGTFVNGKRIQAATLLNKGDKVRFGGADFILLKPARSPAGAAPPMTVRPTTNPSASRKPRRWTTSLRLIAESVLVGFVLGFAAAQYLAYRLYHEQSKILLAEAVPVQRVEPQRAQAEDSAVAQNSAGNSASVPSGGGNPAEPPETSRSGVGSEAPATGDSTVLPAVMALAQLVPGSGGQAGPHSGVRSLTCSHCRGKPFLFPFAPMRQATSFAQARARATERLRDTRNRPSFSLSRVFFRRIVIGGGAMSRTKNDGIVVRRLLGLTFLAEA